MVLLVHIASVWVPFTSESKEAIAGYPEIIRELGRAGLAGRAPTPWSRIIIEKPFGHDLDSARELNRRVLEVCPAERLTLNPDCGFGWSPRYLANQKLTALAAGVALARRELTGSGR
jgi:hypothetical protein